MHGQFLQSENWEKFQQSLGNETVRIEGAFFIRHRLPFGFSYLYCPRPTSTPELDKIKIIAKQSDTFVWFDPAGKIPNNKSQITNKYQSIISKHPKQPKSTLVLDLEKTEDELLAQMHQKTRYNIRLAQKHNVRIRNPESGIQNKNIDESIDIFWQLIQETNKRDNIHSHSKKHYQKLLEIAGGQIFIAYYDDMPVASAICISDSDSFYYLHGASTHTHKNVMAPYLLQWEMIKYAKAKGFKYYDFWGVDEQKYPGVTRFKMGFAPNADISTYPSATLLPLRPMWFRIYSLLKK